MKLRLRALFVFCGVVMVEVEFFRKEFLLVFVFWVFLEVVETKLLVFFFFVEVLRRLAEH